MRTGELTAAAVKSTTALARNPGPGFQHSQLSLQLGGGGATHTHMSAHTRAQAHTHLHAHTCANTHTHAHTNLYTD